MMLPLLALAHLATLTITVNARGFENPERHQFTGIQPAIDWVAAHPGDSPVEIVVSSGTYFIEHALTIGPGATTQPLTIRAESGRSRPVIDGARRIRGWQVQANGWWTVQLPDVAAGNWYFSDLFVNGHRRFRPRLPRRGYYNVADTAQWKGSGSTSPNAFQFSSGQFDPSWSNQGDIELDLFHNWFITHGRIDKIDGNVVRLKSGTGFADGWADLAKGNRFLIDNVKEAMGEPGDWYLDRHSGLLTYVPEPGESPDKTDVRAPIAPQLLNVQGDAEHGHPVSGVLIDGLAFRHTNWNIPIGGRSFPQAEADLGGAIHFGSANHCRIENCEIAQVGEYGIEFGDGCSVSSVDNCSIHDLGGGGVKIGMVYLPTKIELQTHNISVTGCQIASGGRRAPAAVGVWIGKSSNNLVQRNTIEDFYYTGISVGWTWGYAASEADHNLIRLNRIGKIGQDVLSDMGGIYTLGIAPGTVLRQNYIHDVSSFSYGGWGIYPDEGSSNLDIRQNVVVRCKSAGFHQHYGQENLVRGNIFAFNRENQLMRTRAEDHISFTFRHNVVLWDTGNLLGSNWTGDQFRMDDNLYWKVGGGPFDFAGQTFAQWQARGLDDHSKIADPEFRDPKRGDFRLRRGSPVHGWPKDDQPDPDVVWKAGSSLRPPPEEPKAWP